MNCVILGDKFHKGQKHLGCDALIKYSGRKTYFKNQYETIKKSFPSAKIIYVYGFDYKSIEKDLVDAYDDVIWIFNEKFNHTGFGNSIAMTKRYIEKNTLLMFGDTLLSESYFKNFNKSDSQIFINKKTESKVGCVIENNTITNLSYGLDNYLSGIYYINKNNAEDLYYLVDNKKLENYFVFEIINKMIEKNITFYPNIHNKTNASKIGVK